MRAQYARLAGRVALLRGLADGERACLGPAYVTVDTTRRCNNVCRGCFFHCVQPRELSPGDQSVQDLPVDTARRLARDLASMGTREIFLSGEGEPLLHPGLCEITSAFKDTGLTVGCFTNGTLIDEAMAERLVRSTLDVLSIAFWAVNPSEHAVWHPGVSADFLERRKRGIELVHRARRLARQPHPIINLQMPLNRGNYRNIRERVELALASRSERVTFGVFRDYDGQFESECLSGEDVEAMWPDLLAASEQLERAGITHNIGEYLERVRFGRHAWHTCPCYAGWFQSYVKVDGTVFPCCRCKQAMGRLTENGFIEIWNGPAYRDFRRRSSDPQQLARLGGECSCPNCCFWHDNRRVYRVWRWIAPLVPSRTKAPVR